ncbi:MAG: hypothetical protein COA81_11625 [Alphaproteobacteria bacterium]|nr:MAG: hypothetical protein COA81_11625 [Alphaproteobacteria bacterium]
MKNAPEMPLNIENSSLEMQEFYTAAEIANLKLPMVPTTKRGVNKMSDDNNWHDRKNMAGASLVRRMYVLIEKRGQSDEQSQST